MDNLRWPPLDEPYLTALIEAVTYASSRFEPIGIVAAGTIIRGNPSPASDLDVFVVHRAPWRQRVQKFFNGVPTELFVNPPEQVERYLESEAREGRPSTAHMLATGFVILEADEVVRDLRLRAVLALERGPEVTAQSLVAKRYGVADTLENALDIEDTDPEMCNLLLYRAVDAAIAYRFWETQRWQPHHKDTLNALFELDEGLAHSALQFSRAPELVERIRLAREVVQRSVGVVGFFEWESEPDQVENA
jgi:hypothetical protein